MRRWRNVNEYKAKIGGVPHEEASGFVGDGVCTKGKEHSGVIVDYVRPIHQDDLQMWCAEFGDEALEMNFATLCKSKKLFEERQQHN